MLVLVIFLLKKGKKLKNRSVLFFITLLIISLIGCKTEIKQVEPKQPELTVERLKNLVTESIEGNKSANDSLSNLIDFSLPTDSVFNKLDVNNIQLNDNSSIFYVLLVYPNPIYNRLAFYNKNLKCYLTDKSLNGNVSVKPIISNGKNFLEVNDNFTAKDLFNLNRTSIYQLSDTSAEMVFRTYTEIKGPALTYTQKIISISQDSIKTEINSSRIGYKKIQDSFTFDPNSNQYVSSQHIFDSLVKYKLDQLNHEVKGKILTEAKTDSLQTQTSH